MAIARLPWKMAKPDGQVHEMNLAAAAKEAGQSLREAAESFKELEDAGYLHWVELSQTAQLNSLPTPR